MPRAGAHGVSDTGRQLQADIGAIERRLAHQLRQSSACKAVAEIPGVELTRATAVVSSIGSPTAFKDGRDIAAWIGLVPRQTGTGVGQTGRTGTGTLRQGS
ncbi:hypothetical protein EJO68_35185 [Variovorax atrisoli]|uniref:transposase n=1 Tax=Variovorax atrisoli TaxID=3394203 RepID=UPI000F7EBD3B|nr:transposase [Variovorax sp. 369]RTD82300.1 hypothetical protein EJO68_35185 [Variovorax sp. 369]